MGKEKWAGLDEEEKWKKRKGRRGNEGLPMRWTKVKGATMKREDSQMGLEEEEEGEEEK